MSDVYEQLGVIDKRFGEEVNRRSIEMILEGNEFAEAIGDRMIGFSGVLKQGKFKVADYLKAVEYTVLRGTGLNMVESWSRVFPDRLFDENGEEKSRGTKKALASLYDKGDLVQMILAQAQVPLHMLFINERMRAASKLFELAMESGNERIQMESADKFLYHVKPPETVKMELDVGFKADETITQLNDTLNRISSLAQDRIKAGAVTPVDVIES